MLNYIWKHLIDTEPRGKITYEFIKDHLPKNPGVIVDCLCGFAPLKKYLNNSKYIGFDLSKEAIDSNKAKHPDATWIVCTDEEYQHQEKTIDILLLLGVSAGEKKTDSKTEGDSALKLIKKYQPECIVLETCVGHYENIKKAKKLHHYDTIYNYCVKKYNLRLYLKFDAKLNRKEVSERIICVFLKN